MVETAHPLVQEKFSQGLTYDQYMATIRYGQNEFEGHYRAFQLPPEDARFFQELVRQRGPIRVLAIGEDWCPDVHRGLPVMAHIARAAGLEYRIFPRDKNMDLMDLYLNQGKFMSIPVFAFFDRDWSPLGQWIERPAAANQWMQKTRQELAHLPQQAARDERRRRRAALEAEWRQEIVRELRELLAPALP
ncbi:MAG: thioredoxin family protein [Chloroflexi bacterium]|nr:thioredoxin family protein [Chloroflexota bacterium]